MSLKISLPPGSMHAFSPDGLKLVAAAALCHTYHGASNAAIACLPKCWRTPFSKEMFRCPDDSPRSWVALQGVKLFYRVLQSMLKAEHDRTGRSDFGTLLSSASFHKCLAACCFEVVIASYRMVSQICRHEQTQCVPLNHSCAFLPAELLPVD